MAVMPAITAMRFNPGVRGKKMSPDALSKSMNYELPRADQGKQDCGQENCFLGSGRALAALG